MRAETVNAVIGATGEIQRVARIVVKLKGRYLATLMDLGNVHKGPVGDPGAGTPRPRDVRVELGLTRLREAIRPAIWRWTASSTIRPPRPPL